MIYKANALMIYSIFDADDIPQLVADDIHAFRRDLDATVIRREGAKVRASRAEQDAGDASFDKHIIL